MKLNKWMKKLWAFALIACLLLQGMPATVLAAEEPTETEAETEAFVIPEDAIFLSTPEDILNLAENCISDAWSRGKVFVLKNDISLSGSAFAGIPSFGGTFLGQGFTISGVQLTGQMDAQGFFRYLQTGALVENLSLKGSVQPVKDGNVDIGGLVGVNSGTVRSCSFSGIISGTERIGGIAGRNKVSGIIENCTVSGIVSGDHYIGGITGENLGVVRFCVNTAAVNDRVDHNSVSATIPSGFSLDSFTAQESISDATNIGGIAGTNSGVIRGCENRANIGYEKMGYNVGGIAGSQIGYITECENYGIINGSNGVGGIVGQFKPNAVLNMGENYMSDLMDQMIGMMNSMGGMMNSMSGMMNGMTFDKENMEESMDMLQDPENWDADSINAAVNEMSNSFNDMYQDMMASGNRMLGQMNSMMGSMGEMVETMEKLNEGLNIKIIDISREDTPENTVAKISDCVNHAAVYGETYVGGIAGIADIEDTTAQNDVQGALNFSTEGEMIMRLVIRNCRNAATISATKQYAGGIVGNMTIGAVIHGLNTGHLDSLNADYVGGIAGSSETYILDSTSRSILAGSKYVGGIAGYGTEVINCRAVSDIAAATKFAGGILGYTDPLPDEETGLILNNRYYLTDKTLGGIDGVCYECSTAPMTVKEFWASEDVDDCFRTVSIRFVAAGQEDIVLTVDLGQSLPIAKIPQLEVGAQEQYQWQLHSGVTAQTLGMGETADAQYISKDRLSNILFDQTYEAIFDAKNMVIASEEKTASGRSLALAVGAFDRDTTLRLTAVSAEEAGLSGIAAAEIRSVTLADIGIEKLHYHIPEDLEAENLALYVKDISGNWVQRNFTVEGSYMIFPFTHGESCFALEILPEQELPLAAIAITAGAVILLLSAAMTVRKRKAKKEATGEKK